MDDDQARGSEDARSDAPMHQDQDDQDDQGDSNAQGALGDHEQSQEDIHQDRGVLGDDQDASAGEYSGFNAPTPIYPASDAGEDSGFAAPIYQDQDDPDDQDAYAGEYSGFDAPTPMYPASDVGEDSEFAAPIHQDQDDGDDQDPLERAILPSVVPGPFSTSRVPAGVRDDEVENARVSIVRAGGKGRSTPHFPSSSSHLRISDDEPSPTKRLTASR